MQDTLVSKEREMGKKFSDTEKLAYWFVTEVLNQTWSYNTHKRFLREAKTYINPKKDPLTEEPQKAYTVEEIKQCLNAMKTGYFGKPVEVTSIHQIVWTNRNTGNTFIEDWLLVPNLPPLYQKMELKDWLDRHGRKAVNQELITQGEYEELLSYAF